MNGQHVESGRSGQIAEERAFAEERRLWEAQRAREETELRRQTEELLARAAELTARLSEIEQRQAHWAEGRVRADQSVATIDDSGPSEPAAPVSPRVTAPVSVSDTLRRIGASDSEQSGHNEPEDPPSEAPRETASRETTNGRTEPESAQPQDGEEESIDDYMARLMQRVRGEAVKGGGSKQESCPQSPQPAASPVRPTVSESAEQSPAELFGAACPEPVELSRVSAPKMTVDLSAMRELANFSAKSAITHHERRQLALGVWTKLLLTIVGLAGGAVLLWMWDPSVSDVTFYGALASFLVAILWGTQYAMMTGRLIVGKMGHLEWNSGRAKQNR